MSAIVRFPTRQGIINEESLVQGHIALPSVLQQMGYSGLRDGQESVVLSLMAQRDTICILPTGCHAKGARLRMYNGDIKTVEDVVPGDQLLGPDQQSRLVLNLCRGRDVMVRIAPFIGEAFEVNQDHILSLAPIPEIYQPHTHTKDAYQEAERMISHSVCRRWHVVETDIVDISVRDWNTWSPKKKSEYGLFRIATTDEYIPAGSVSVSGFSPFTVEYLGEDDYYGFTLNKDGRYVMEDFTVTHNTGKTACFVIPTLCLDWKTVVFSPLVALMRDQVQSLHRMGIPAAQMSSTQTDAENAMAVRAWMAGELSLFYVAPERLGNHLFKEAVSAVPPDMVVLDEAHTLSQWSDNFRPSYQAVGDFIAQKDPKVVAAFTATAPDEVEVDIRRVLGLGKAIKLIHYPRRKNLELTTEDYRGIQELARRVESVQGTVLVYCSTIKRVEETAQQLTDILHGTEVTMYHGELTPAAKRTNQDLFMSNRVKVMVATNAFGMGIDKPDIRAVIHRDLPGSIEALAQEQGRAGRDGKHSLCLAYYDEQSYRTQEFFIRCAFPSKRDVQSVYNVLLESMDRETQTCHMTADEIGKKAGLKGGAIGAVFSILIGNNVVERIKSDVSIARIKTLKEDTDPRFKDWQALWQRGGELDHEGFYNVDLNWLVINTGLGKPTVTKHLRAWDKNDIIAYVAPFRGSPTRIIGDISCIDFERLKDKEKKAWEKLDDVVKFFQIPQAEKHSFIEKYFGVHSES